MTTIIMFMGKETDEKSKAANKEFREQVYAYVPSLDLPSEPRFVEISSLETDIQRVFEENIADAVFTTENSRDIQSEAHKRRIKTFEWQFTKKKMVRIFVNKEKMIYMGQESTYLTIGYL